MDPTQMPPGMPPPGMMPPEGMPPPMGGAPEGMPPAPMPEVLPEMPPAEMPPSPAPSPSKGDEQKKQVLQKLISNLLGKPGRSFNELANGIKMAITSYKSYAKEIDLLNGISPEGSSGAPATSGPPAGGSSSEIQKILNSIQQKKAPSTDGAGGPGVQYQPPTIVPPTPQPIPNNQDSFIAGQSQQSGFNRPAPVSNFGVFGF